jgi:hypothetical protein
MLRCRVLGHGRLAGVCWCVMLWQYRTFENASVSLAVVAWNNRRRGYVCLGWLPYSIACTTRVNADFALALQNGHERLVLGLQCMLIWSGCLLVFHQHLS